VIWLFGAGVIISRYVEELADCKGQARLWREHRLPIRKALLDGRRFLSFTEFRVVGIPELHERWVGCHFPTGIRAVGRTDPRAETLGLHDG
jgi:hypothetical protein